MSAGPGRQLVERADVARFLVAFGLVPLLLAREFTRDVPPWSFGLAPDWSPEQLGFVIVAGATIGLTSSRPATGLAAVAIGSLLGLAADLWWLAGFVRPEDQEFVSLLPQAEWQARVAGSALALLGAVCAGFVVGAVVRRLVRDRAGPPRRPPQGTELAAVGIAAIGGPLLALGIAVAAASSGLVVPDGSQVQTVRFAAGTITVDPAVLRPGPTRFRCLYAPDAEQWGALIGEIPEGADAGTLAPFDDYRATCDVGDGVATWGTIADLRPGRHAWQQIDNSGESWRVIATSPVVVVAP